MNQIEQVTSITGSAIDAAIQDERMVELEQRIEKLETSATINDGLIGHVAKLQYDAARQVKRIEKLEICAVINANIIGQVELLKVALVEQGMRIERLEAAIRVVNRAWDTIVEHTERLERLETEAALSKEQRLQVVANTDEINRIHSRFVKRLAKLERAQRQSET